MSVIEFSDIVSQKGNPFQAIIGDVEKLGEAADTSTKKITSLEDALKEIQGGSGKDMQSLEKILKEINKILAESTRLAKTRADIESQNTAKAKEAHKVEQERLKTEREKIKADQKRAKEDKKKLDRAKQQAKAEKDLADSIKRGAKSISQLTAQNALLMKVRKGVNRETDSGEGALKQLENRLGKLRQAYSKLSQEQRENISVGGKQLTEIQELDKEVKDLRASMGQHQMNVGNYSSAFDGLTGRLSELTANINPATMAVAGISAAMVAGAKAVFDVDTSLRSVQAQFQVTGEEANRLNEEIRVVADVFGKDYNEVIQAK